MFGFLGKKKAKKGVPIIRARPDHCISRKNIDQDALRVLYRLDKLGYTAYLVGGNFYAALFTYLALVARAAFILTAMAFPVLLGSKNALAEKTACFGL